MGNMLTCGSDKEGPEGLMKKFKVRIAQERARATV